jgi:phytoene synthase
MRSSITDLARHYEPDRFVTALLAPRSLRDDLLTIAAFGAEITKIRLEVSEPALAQIRLQWWREAMCDPSAARSSGHPVGQALSATMIHNDMTPDLINECLIAAQQAVVAGADYVAQFARAESILFQITTDILSDPVDRERSGAALIAACMHAGNAYGGARLVFENLQKYQQNQAVEDDPRLRSLIETARKEARMAKSARLALKPALALAFHPLALVEPYLQLTEHPRGQAARTRFAALPLYRMWRIGRAHLGKV